MALQHTKTSGAARMAVLYITLGALMDVWTALWYIFKGRHIDSQNAIFWCCGFFFTGLTLVIIGLALGRIGRSARHAEAPTDNTTNNAPAQAQQPVANAQMAAPMATPGGTVTPSVAAQPVANVPGTYQPR